MNTKKDEIDSDPSDSTTQPSSDPLQQPINGDGNGDPPDIPRR